MIVSHVWHMMVMKMWGVGKVFYNWTKGQYYQDWLIYPWSGRAFNIGRLMVGKSGELKDWDASFCLIICPSNWESGEGLKKLVYLLKFFGFQLVAWEMWLCMCFHMHHDLKISYDWIDRSCLWLSLHLGSVKFGGVCSYCEQLLL